MMWMWAWATTLSVFSEDAAKAVGNLAYGGVGFARFEDSWHQIVGGAGGLFESVQPFCYCRRRA